MNTNTLVEIPTGRPRGLFTFALGTAATVIAVSTLTACSTKIVKTEDLALVKRVAIVGLDLQQQKAVSGEDLASIALKTAESPKAEPALRAEAPHAADVYKDLAAKIEKQTGWKVLSQESVRANASYTKLFKDKTEGFQNRPMINNRFVVLSPSGILDSFAIQTTKPDRLQQLAKDLKVDALIYATSTVNLNNNSVIMSMVGKGEFKPSANTSVFVIDARTGEKIFMNSAEGPKVAQGERNTLGMADDQKLNLLAKQATAMSMDEVLKELAVKR